MVGTLPVLATGGDGGGDIVYLLGGQGCTDAGAEVSPALHLYAVTYAVDHSGSVVVSDDGQLFRLDTMDGEGSFNVPPMLSCQFLRCCSVVYHIGLLVSGIVSQSG